MAIDGLRTGALGFSVLRIWPIFGSVFRFLHLKTAVFRFSRLKLRFFGFGVLRGLRVFSNLVFGFRFLSTLRASFRFFCSMLFTVFSGFAKKVTRCSRAKTVIPRHHSYSVLNLSFSGMNDKLSLFTSRYLGRNGCQAVARCLFVAGVKLRSLAPFTWNKSKGETVSLVVKCG